MSDEIRKLSDELARDPSSQTFLSLGDELRRTSQLGLALKVALRGVERHPQNADAHDLVARIAVDRGDMGRAIIEWDQVLTLAPDHVGARKGLGYVLFKQGRLHEAERHLNEAAALDGGDPSIGTALMMVRKSLLEQPETRAEAGVSTSTPTEEPPTTERSRWRSAAEEARCLFADILGDGEQTALLVDADGLAVAGAYVTEDGKDTSEDVAAALSGFRDEVQRAMRHLDMGGWTSVTMETDVATVAMGPVARDFVLLVAAAKWEPLGFVHRVLEKCAHRAQDWLGEGL